MCVTAPAMCSVRRRWWVQAVVCWATVLGYCEAWRCSATSPDDKIDLDLSSTL